MHHANTPVQFRSLKPLFYIVKLGFTGVSIVFLISPQMNRLWVQLRTAYTSIGSSYDYKQFIF